MSTLKDVERALKEAINKINSPQELRKIGEIAAEMVRTRTRLGYGVREDRGKRQKLKPLADSTKKVRAGKLAFKNIRGTVVPFPPDLEENKVKLHPLTSAGKSNLTRSGQMLDSWKVISVGQGRVLIGPTGQRDDGLTNEQVAEFSEELGRPFGYITDIEYKRLVDEVRKRLTKIAESILTKL